MNQSIKTFVAGMFLGLGFISITTGQNMYASNQAISTGTASVLILDEPIGSSNPAATAPLAAASFSALFPNATDQKWSNTTGNSFVSFLNNGRKATASFDAKGNISYSITACGMEQLPAAFSKAIKKDYAAYGLFHATEIKAHGGTAYQAILENTTRFITLKFTVDGLEEIQSVKK